MYSSLLHFPVTPLLFGPVVGTPSHKLCSSYLTQGYTSNDTQMESRGPLLGVWNCRLANCHMVLALGELRIRSHSIY